MSYTQPELVEPLLGPCLHCGTLYMVHTMIKGKCCDDCEHPIKELADMYKGTVECAMCGQALVGPGTMRYDTGTHCPNCDNVRFHVIDTLKPATEAMIWRTQVNYKHPSFWRMDMGLGLYDPAANDDGLTL